MLRREPWLYEFETVEEAADLLLAARPYVAGLPVGRERPGVHIARQVIPGDVGDHEVATRAERVFEGSDDPGWVFLIGNEVQDLQEKHRDRLREVEMLADVRQAQQFPGLAEVGLHDDDLLRLGEQGVSVGDHDRVAVDVGHLRVRVRPVGDFVHVLLGWQAGPDVQELADALFR